MGILSRVHPQAFGFDVFRFFAAGFVVDFDFIASPTVSVLESSIQFRWVTTQNKLAFNPTKRFE
jgi:hypothetical protein